MFCSAIHFKKGLHTKVRKPFFMRTLVVQHRVGRLTAYENYATVRCLRDRCFH